MKFTALLLLPILAIAVLAAPIPQSQNPRALVINTSNALSHEFKNFAPDANTSLKQKMASMKRADAIYRQSIKTYKGLKRNKRANSQDDEELKNAATSLANGTVQMFKSVNPQTLSPADQATYKSSAQSAASMLNIGDQIVNALLSGLGVLASALNSIGLLDLLGALLPNPL